MGYTERSIRTRGLPSQPGPIKVPSLQAIQAALLALGLRVDHLFLPNGKPNKTGKKLAEYYQYRADILNQVVASSLMSGTEAKQLFLKLRERNGMVAAVPMNKPSGEKKNPAYFTGLINMLINAEIGQRPCNFNPQELTTFTKDGAPFRTLARRVDGAFPSPVNPLAIWEIKEYYNTTTFGSRVADGVYESLLDGLELEELESAWQGTSNVNPAAKQVQHLLMVDAHYTWWIKGRSYLCRIIDMLHMGYVDEVLFGREIMERLPIIVRGWIARYDKRDPSIA